MHVAAFHLGLAFDNCHILQVIGKTLKDGQALFGVGHLAAAEHDRDLDLVSTLQEAKHVLLLGGVVAHVDLRAELHFLGFDLVLVLTSLLCLDGLVVLELAVVHDAADRRISLRGDLYQVVAFALCDAQSLRSRVDAQLGSVVADQATFLGPDLVVEPWLLSSYSAHLLLMTKRACKRKPEADALRVR